MGTIMGGDAMMATISHFPPGNLGPKFKISSYLKLKLNLGPKLRWPFHYRVDEITTLMDKDNQREKNDS